MEKTNVALSGPNSTWPPDKQEHKNWAEMLKTPKLGQNAKDTLIWAKMLENCSAEAIVIGIKIEF